MVGVGSDGATKNRIFLGIFVGVVIDTIGTEGGRAVSARTEDLLGILHFAVGVCRSIDDVHVCVGSIRCNQAIKANR